MSKEEREKHWEDLFNKIQIYLVEKGLWEV